MFNFQSGNFPKVRLDLLRRRRHYTSFITYAYHTMKHIHNSPYHATNPILYNFLYHTRPCIIYQTTLKIIHDIPYTILHILYNLLGPHYKTYIIYITTLQIMHNLSYHATNPILYNLLHNTTLCINYQTILKIIHNLPYTHYTSFITYAYQTIKHK